MNEKNKTKKKKKKKKKNELCPYHTENLCSTGKKGACNELVRNFVTNVTVVRVTRTLNRTYLTRKSHLRSKASFLNH